LTNCVFINSDIENVRFINCEFDFKNFIYEKEQTNKFINDKNNIIAIKELISSYRQFEINLDKNKDYELAGEFHKKRYELEYLITESFSLKKLLLFFYERSSNFGENYVKSLSRFILILFLFTLTYLFTGLVYNHTNFESTIYYLKESNRYNFWNDIGSAFLYSLNNSLPFRRELEFVKSANGWTTFFSIVQTFIQTILATLFIIGLRRKFKR